MKNKKIILSLLLLTHYAFIESKYNSQAERITRIESGFKGMSQQQAREAFENETLKDKTLNNESYKGPILDYIKTLPLVAPAKEEPVQPKQDTKPIDKKQDQKPVVQPIQPKQDPVRPKQEPLQPKQDTKPINTKQDQKPVVEPLQPKQDPKPQVNEENAPRWEKMNFAIITSLSKYKADTNTGLKEVTLTAAARDIQHKLRKIRGYQLPVKNRLADGADREAFNGAFRNAVLFNEYFTNSGFNWSQSKDIDYTQPLKFYKEIKFNTSNKTNAIKVEEFDTLAYKAGLEVIIVADDATLRRTNDKTKTVYTANEISDKELKENQKRRHELFDDIAQKMITADKNNKPYFEYFMVEDYKDHFITFVATHGLLKAEGKHLSYFVMDDNNASQLNNKELYDFMVEIESALDRKLYPTMNEKEAKFTERSFKIVEKGETKNDLKLKVVEKEIANTRTAQFKSTIAKDIENKNGTITIKQECRVAAYKNVRLVEQFFEKPVYTQKTFKNSKESVTIEPFAVQEPSSIGFSITSTDSDFAKPEKTFIDLTYAHSDLLYVVNEHARQITKVYKNKETDYLGDKAWKLNDKGVAVPVDEKDKDKKHYNVLYTEIATELNKAIEAKKRQFVPFMVCVENGTEKQHYITLVVAHLPELLSQNALTAFVLDSYDNSDYTSHRAVEFIISKLQASLKEIQDAEKAKKNPITVEEKRTDGFDTVALAVKKSTAASVDKKNGDPVKLAGIKKTLDNNVELIQVPAKLTPSEKIEFNTNAALRNARMIDDYFDNRMYDNPETNKTMDYRAPFVEYTKMNFRNLDGISETTARTLDRLSKANSYPVYIVNAELKEEIKIANSSTVYYKQGPLNQGEKSYSDLFDTIAQQLFDTAKRNEGRNKQPHFESFMINISKEKDKPLFVTLTITLLPEVDTLYAFILNSTDKELSLLTNQTIKNIAEQIGSRYRKLQQKADEERTKAKENRPKSEADELEEAVKNKQ